MKVEELMIGDWVEISGAPEPVVIREVYGNGAMTSACNVCHDEIFPIPLTPEILKKNGFSNYADSWYFPSDEKNIRIGFHMHETVLDIKTDNASFYKKIPYGYRSIIKYGSILSVHEFQHALKLCGIEKEIKV